MGLLTQGWCFVSKFYLIDASVFLAGNGSPWGGGVWVIDKLDIELKRWVRKMARTKQKQ
jgi:hypothetical protein